MIGLLNQTVQIYQSNSHDRRGREVWSSPFEKKARVELKERRRFDQQGQITITAGTLFLQPDVQINTNDKFTYQSEAYRVFSVNEQVDGTGIVHHLTVEFTKWPTSA